MNHCCGRIIFSTSEDSGRKLRREKVKSKQKKIKISQMEQDLESDLKRQVIERMLQNGLKSKLI